MNYLDNVYQKFKTISNSKPCLVRSPARINLIGEHTDYNQGFVLPAAIDKELIFAVAPNSLHQFRFFASNFNDYLELPSSDVIKPFQKHTWVNYLLGVVEQLQKLGHHVPSFDCVFGGNIPNGAGLSSSAAVECGLATALNEVFGFGLSKIEIVKLCQKAENEFVGVKCGIMDQFANTFGQQDSVILLDCRNLEHQYFSIQLIDYQLVLLDTGVHHSLASSEYNTRRKQCEQGINTLKRQEPTVLSLRDATSEMLQIHQSSFEEVIWKRCNYVVQENARVQNFCKALKADDLTHAGKLMYASHHGLQYDYEVSCAELDFLVGIAANDSNVLGARMMGGGFGGCTLNLLNKEAVEQFIAKARNAYEKYFQRDLRYYAVSISAGTSVLHAPF